MSPGIQTPLIYLNILWELSPYGEDWKKIKEWAYMQRYNRMIEEYSTYEKRQEYLYLLANGFI